MITRIVGAFILMLVATKSFAGYDVIFCTNFDSLGHCKESADEFKWTGEKMKLHMIVLNKDGLNTSKISFKIFFLDDNAERELMAELSTAVRGNWLYAVKEAIFFKPGRYKVDVYNAKNEVIANSFITITDR